MKPLARVICLLSLLAVSGLNVFKANAAPPSQTASLTLAARAGFDGYYKAGTWVPVRITLENNGPDVNATLRATLPRDSGSNLYFTRELELPTQSRREFFLYVSPENFASTLKITLTDKGTSKETNSASVRLVQAGAVDLLYGIWANSPSTFNILAELDPANGTAYVAQLDLADLPPLAQAWEGLDALVISDVDTGALSPEQRTALASWVTSGGRLIVAGGASWQKVAAGLGAVLPFSPAGTRTIASPKELGEFANFTTPDGNLIAARGTLAQGAVTILSQADLPLIVSQPMGVGDVTFLAFDPALAPLKGWDGLEGMFLGLLSTPLDRPTWVGGFRNAYSARDAVNAVPTIDLPSAFQICGFLGFYVLLIGPINFFVLRQLKRRELAWITIPVIVLLFTGVAYLTGYQLRGTQATLHQLSVVQIWPGASEARVDALVGLFSPRRQEYDVEFPTGFIARPFPSSYGSSSDITIEEGDQHIARYIRSDVGSVEGFITRGQIPAPKFESDVRLELRNASVYLSGSMTNLSEVTLEGAKLLAPGNVIDLGQFAPGETKTLAQTWYSSFNGRATPDTAYLPVPGGWGAPMMNYYGYDTTIQDILGANVNYYDDKESYRKYSLLNALADQNGTTSRGSGVYLTGWTSAAPFSAQVVDRTFTTVDQTLYLIAVNIGFTQANGAKSISPGLMVWSVVDAGTMGISPSPYDVYLSQPGYYAIQFRPARLVQFDQVKKLTLHLNSYGSTGVAPLKVSLWDFSEEVWVEQTKLYWGDTDITAPARHVGPAGEVRARIENLTNQQSNLETLDFTIVVE